MDGSWPIHISHTFHPHSPSSPWALPSTRQGRPGRAAVGSHARLLGGGAASLGQAGRPEGEAKGSEAARNWPGVELLSCPDSPSGHTVEWGGKVNWACLYSTMNEQNSCKWFVSQVGSA